MVATASMAAYVKGDQVAFDNVLFEIPQPSDPEALALKLTFHRGHREFQVGGLLRRTRRVVSCVLGDQPATSIENKKDRWLGLYMWWAKFTDFNAGTYVLMSTDDLGGTDQLNIRISFGQ